MSKFVETQTRKIIGSYGGVGSIIETPIGALKIEHFDKWSFYKKQEHLNSEHHIEDDRLLNRLRFEKGFPRLKAFVKVPTNVAHFKNKTIPQNFTDVISAKFFPEWFYCNKCGRLRKISDWWEGWKITLQQFGEDKKKIRDTFYDSPKCYKCYERTRRRINREKRFKMYFDLEQIRFILTSPKGDIEDIPWERWNKVQKKTKDKDSDSGSIIVDFENQCCKDQDLRYIKSTKFSDMAGISIKCNKCGSHQTLSGLFGLRLPVYTNQDSDDKQFKKPVIRTSNSVYYPIIIRSIYLPTELIIKQEDAQEIDESLDDGESEDIIVRFFKRRGYSEQVIKNYIQNKKLPEFEPEIEYRHKEYNFITNPERRNYPDNEKETINLIFEKQQIDKLKEIGFENLMKLKKIKMTIVQTAYTRQEPMDKDQFLKGEFDRVKPKYTSKYGKQTEYLPAIENFGEGLFFNLDNDKIDKWLDKILNDNKFSQRIKTIQTNAEHNELIKKDRFSDIRFLSKFILIHTLSHILIKEFEFSVGYPATSLNERLYINDSDMSGLMIYTVAGAEGSYGGLISNANEKNFMRILHAALYRAKDCASDPVCYNSLDGQGIGDLNMAACYSCALIPDISCEEFNSFLDRGLLIDENFGFFRDFL